MDYLIWCLMFFMLWTASMVTFHSYTEKDMGIAPTLLFSTMLFICTMIGAVAVNEEYRMIRYVYLKPLYQSWNYKGEVYETGNSIFPSK